MKKLFVIFTAAILLLGTSMVQAGGYGGYHGGYGYHGGGHRGGSVGVHYGYRGSGKFATYLFGGLVLGGILNYAFSHPHRKHHHSHRHQSHGHYSHRDNYITPRSHTVHRKVVRNTYSSQPKVTQQSHLHRDRHGNCFRVSYNDLGEELRAEQPRSVCDW